MRRVRRVPVLDDEMFVAYLESMNKVVKIKSKYTPEFQELVLELIGSNQEIDTTRRALYASLNSNKNFIAQDGLQLYNALNGKTARVHTFSYQSPAELTEKLTKVERTTGFSHIALIGGSVSELASITEKVSDGTQHLHVQLLPRRFFSWTKECVYIEVV